jgi:hypothetical protein
MTPLAPSPVGHDPAAGRHVLFASWRRDALERGTSQGTEVTGGRLTIAEPVGTLLYDDPWAGRRRPTRYEWAAWVSPEVEHAFGATSLVPSWNAATPGDSWVTVEARTASVHEDGGRRWSPWFTVARWADSDREIHPTSVPGQGDEVTSVQTDVLDAREGAAWVASQLRLTLARRPGSEARPEVTLAGVVASRVPVEAPEQVSRGGVAWGLELPVPALSQQLHRDAYLRWDGGGRSWCSPTSTTMLLAFHDRLPGPDDYAWVDDGSPDPCVVHAARRVFDHAYAGAGNWAFNTAYAGSRGATAFVTRLRSLAEAELFVAAGLPLAASVAFTEDGLTGAGYETDGHLLTVVGFTADGDVICNDPASHTIASNDAVRVVYDRHELERVWLGSSGGIVYVVHTDEQQLPERPVPTEPNW